MSDTHKFATDLARQAGETLLNYFSLTGIATNLKADRTVVTEADLAADKVIVDAINAAYPQDQILSEESSPNLNPTSAAIWVIDPLDGTSNFSLGMPIWGVSIARLVDGQPDTAALYFPTIGELYSAQRGQGAFLNGQAIHPKGPRPEHPAAFFSCCSRTHRQYDVQIRYKIRILGAAAYSFCNVARGAAVLGFQATPKIWDIAAGWLVLAEAGGVVDVLHGAAPFPLKTGLDYASASFPTLMAADATTAQEGYDKIKLH